jgi:hypothetical protein
VLREVRASAIEGDDDVKGSGSASGGGVVDLLEHEDSEIDRLFGVFFSSDCAPGSLRRGVVGRELVDRVSMQDAANREIARRLVRDVGRLDLAEELDRHSRRCRRLVGELDDISAGVSPRDMGRSDADRFDVLINELRDLRHEQAGFELEHLIPTLRDSMSRQDQERLVGEIDRVRRGATTRQGPDRSSPPRVGPTGDLFGRVRVAVDRARGVSRSSR